MLIFKHFKAGVGRFLAICLLCLTALSSKGQIIDLKPKWNNGDKFNYTIKINDIREFFEFPIALILNDESYITQDFSFRILSHNNNDWQIECSNGAPVYHGLNDISSFAEALEMGENYFGEGLQGIMPEEYPTDQNFVGNDIDDTESDNDEIIGEAEAGSDDGGLFEHQGGHGKTLGSVDDTADYTDFYNSCRNLLFTASRLTAKKPYTLNLSDFKLSRLNFLLSTKNSNIELNKIPVLLSIESLPLGNSYYCNDGDSITFNVAGNNGSTMVKIRKYSTFTEPYIEADDNMSLTHSTVHYSPNLEYIVKPMLKERQSAVDEYNRRMTQLNAGNAEKVTQTPEEQTVLIGELSYEYDINNNLKKFEYSVNNEQTGKRRTISILAK